MLMFHPVMASEYSIIMCLFVDKNAFRTLLQTKYPYLKKKQFVENREKSHLESFEFDPSNIYQMIEERG